jgi:phosphatidylglycerol:prolipoprotein diacylglycerol transferase
VDAVLIYLYCRKHKIDATHFCDAIAPALKLAYAIGRLGCHFSGDGDWGILNSAFISFVSSPYFSASLI